MASADVHDLPVYALRRRPVGVRHMSLTRAVRWRVVVEVLMPTESDIILNTVLRLRSLGLNSPTRIADLLQLPEDLIRHLLAQAAYANLRVSDDGALAVQSTSVAWIYRDVATGEMWPDLGPESPPLLVRFSSPLRAQFDAGTAGRPVRVHCLLLRCRDAHASEPTGSELSRLGTAPRAVSTRTAVVGSGEECLVASTVTSAHERYSIEVMPGVPHISLSQLLNDTAGTDPAVARWLSEVPETQRAATASAPLQSALTELREEHGDRIGKLSPDEVTVLLVRIELCLSRAMDQIEYVHHLDLSGRSEDEPIDVALVRRFGLSTADALLLSAATEGSLSHRVAQLMSSGVGESWPSDSGVVELAKLVAEYSRHVRHEREGDALHALVQRTARLCDSILTATEDPDER